MSITRDSVHKRRPTGGKRVAYRKKRKFEIGRQPAMTRLGAKVVHLVRCRFGIVKHRALRLESGNFAWPTQAIAHRTRIMNVVYNASNNELVRTNTLVRNAIVQIDATPFRQWFLKYYGIELGKRGARAAKKEGQEAKETQKAEDPTIASERKKASQEKAERRRKKFHKLMKMWKAEKARKKAGKGAEKVEDGKKEEKDEGKESKKAVIAKEGKKVKKEEKLEVKKSKKPMKHKKKEKKVGFTKVQLARFAKRRRRYRIEKALADQFLTGKLLACITSRPGQVGRADGYILEGNELEFYQRKLEKKKKK